MKLTFRLPQLHRERERESLGHKKETLCQKENYYFFDGTVRSNEALEILNKG